MRARRPFWVALVAVVLCGAVIKSGATTDTWTIDPTSKAGRVTLYDARGNMTGQKATYSAGLTALTATGAGTGPFFSICGSATQTIRVRRVYVAGRVATAAVYQAVVLTKTSTATSSGTPVALTQVPHDSTSGAGTAALCNYYSALATTGNAVGNVGGAAGNWPITATVAMTDNYGEINLNLDLGLETEGVVLRGTAQCLQAAFAATTTNVPTLLVNVVWTQE